MVLVDQHHELVSRVKELALELGRTPTRAEFISRVRGADYRLAKLGGYTALLQASGLDTYSDRRSGHKDKPKKIDNRVFERDLEAHLEAYQPRPQETRKPFPTAAIISDIHWPFESKRVVDAFLAYVDLHKPEWVIINGDAVDMYSFSKYPRSHNIFMPKDEMRLARERNEEFWRQVKKRSPKSRCIQMMGNHDIRPLRRVIESLPVAEDWIAEKLREYFTFEGVETIHDPREELMLRDDIAVFHGYRTQLGAHRDYTHMSCINGHTHRGGVVYKKIKGSVLFELNSGVAGDPESKGLSYTSQKINEWTPGFGAIDAYGPRFIYV